MRRKAGKPLENLLDEEVYRAAIPILPLSALRPGKRRKKKRASSAICVPLFGRHATFSTPAEAYQESFFNAQSHFIHCLRAGELAENEAADNLKTLAATFAAYESAARNQAVSLS